jgi:hypothetical protein
VNGTVELISPVWWLRQLAAFTVMAVALLLWSGDVDARLKGESSFIRSALPSYIASPPVSKYIVVAALDHPSPGIQSGSLGGLFSRPGLLGGFASGFLGAGFLGLFFGHGVFGGLNGVAACLGLAFQLALVAMLCRLIWMWWTGRKEPAFTGLSPRQLADPYLRTRHELLPGGAAPLSDGDEESGATEHPEQHTQSAAAGER